jgi:selenide, water dikinase
MSQYDLLQNVEYGGCSAKLSAAGLKKALAGLPDTPHPDLLVGTETHDDAGVYRINDELALIQTTDFFSPVCSDPYEFGQIAAANAVSDVYAMGGEVLTALNIVAFPANVSLDILREILSGGIDKVKEAGGVMMGGHTIVDPVPKYGLAVTGTVHPDRIITNAAAMPGDLLILTKPLGAGVIMAGHRIGEVKDEHYKGVLESMKLLNKAAVPVMQQHNVRCATDITGFGLAGHALKMAMASIVTLQIRAESIPVFPGVMELLNMGCIPGACFRNREFTDPESHYSPAVMYEQKMFLNDAQTSGGLLICCKPNQAEQMVTELVSAGYTNTAIIGEVLLFQGKRLKFKNEE